MGPRPGLQKALPARELHGLSLLFIGEKLCFVLRVRASGPGLSQGCSPRALGTVNSESKVPESILEEPSADRALWARVLHSGATLCIVGQLLVSSVTS